MFRGPVNLKLMIAFKIFKFIQNICKTTRHSEVEGGESKQSQEEAKSMVSN